MDGITYFVGLTREHFLQDAGLFLAGDQDGNVRSSTQNRMGKRVEYTGTGVTMDRAAHWAMYNVNAGGNTTIFGVVRIGAL